MATPVWQNSTLYRIGSLVLPTSKPEWSVPDLENPGFEAGTTTGWDVVPFGGSGTATAVNIRKYTGSYCGRWQGASGGGHAGGVEADWVNGKRGRVTPGKTISGSVMISFDDTSQSQNRGRARLYWFDEDMQQIGYLDGSLLSGNSEAWRMSTVSGPAPANAAYASVGAWVTANYSGAVFIDDAKWSYVYDPPSGLVYRAVELTGDSAEIGLSGSTEPAWPPVLGERVVDNEVTWEAVLGTSITWVAEPIMKTGAIEPTWPSGIGDFVSDGTVNWRASTRAIEDPKHPKSPLTFYIAGKVYKGDGDIAPYSATNNPLNWSAPNDAGYLPINMNDFGDNDIAGFGQYRSNLVVFNARGFQMWQVDQDPSLSSFLDAIAEGSTENWMITPIGDDLAFWTHAGMRSVSIAAASTNLASGDIGSPVDPLMVADYLAAQAQQKRPWGYYIPGLGELWVGFNVAGTHPVLGAYGSRVWVYTRSKQTKVSGWSVYHFPYEIEGMAVDGSTVILRMNGAVLELDPDILSDFSGDAREAQMRGLVRWNYLDLQPGAEKIMQSFDVIQEGSSEISFYWNQNDEIAVTEPYLLDGDNVPIDPIDYELAFASVSIQLVYTEAQAWRFLALAINYQVTR